MISDWTQLLRWLSMNSRYLLHNELHAQMTDQWSIWIWTPMRTIGNQLFTMPTISLFIFLFRQRTRTRISSCAVVEPIVQSHAGFMSSPNQVSVIRITARKLHSFNIFWLWGIRTRRKSNDHASNLVWNFQSCLLIELTNPFREVWTWHLDEDRCIVYSIQNMAVVIPTSLPTVMPSSGIVLVDGTHGTNESTMASQRQCPLSRISPLPIASNQPHWLELSLQRIERMIFPTNWLFYRDLR